MDYLTLRSVINGSSAGNGVLCGIAQIATSYNNTGIVGSGA
jgi:hypothetical protein